MGVALTENISLPPAQHYWIKPTPLHRSGQPFCTCPPPLYTSLFHNMHLLELLGNICLCLAPRSPFSFLKQTPTHPTKPSSGTTFHETPSPFLSARLHHSPLWDNSDLSGSKGCTSPPCNLNITYSFFAYFIY